MKTGLRHLKNIWPAILLTVWCSCLHQLPAQDLDPAVWPHLKGYWKFQNVSKLTKGTVGKDLVLTGTHQVVSGPAVGDTAIRIAIGSYYTCSHGMAPNGGGDSVNRYTLMFDFKVLSFKKWHTFFKTDSNNNNDGECFIRPLSGSKPGCIGVAATGYSKDSINPNQWYRLMISVNLNNFYRYYLNGKLLHEGDTQEVDGRFALTPRMIFFGDDNQEDDTIDVASVAVFDTCLSAAQVATIGSIDPCVARPPKISLGRDTALCDYNTIVKNPGAGFKKYQWSTGSTQASVTFSKALGYGKRNIWCKVTDQNGCIAADTFALTFNPSPVVNLGSDQQFCKGYTLKLTAGTDTSSKYLWKYLPKGNILSQKNTFQTDSGGKYAVIVTNTVNCISTDTILITVYALPPKPVISITGKTGLCEGESVLLTAPSGYFDYIWNKGANMQTISSSKNDTLKVKVVDMNNCVSPYSDSVVVRVFKLPPKPVIQLTGNDTFCSGDSVQLTATGGYSQYLWKDGPFGGIRFVNQAGWYFVSVKDVNGCKSAVSDSLHLTVHAVPVKPIVTVQGKTEFCQGERTYLTGPSGSFRYLWSDNQQSMTDTISASGNYSLTLINNFGCRSVASNAVKVLVHPLPPKPLIIQKGLDSLLCSNTDSAYRWYLNGSLLGVKTRSIRAGATGYYSVMTFNGHCYSPLSDSILMINSGTHAPVLYIGMKVWPNPSNTLLHIQANIGSGAVAQLSLLDAEGRKLSIQITDTEELMRGVVMDVSILPQGVYRIILRSEGNFYNAGFVRN